MEDVSRLSAAASIQPALSALAGKARAWSSAVDGAQRNLTARVASGRAQADELGAANEFLLSLERSVCDPAGIPKRPWFRNLIYAPLPSYRAETLPAIREALVAGDAAAASAQVERLAARLDAATAAARRISAPASPPPRPTPRHR